MILDTIFLHCGDIDREVIENFNPEGLINKPDGFWLSQYEEDIGSDWLRYNYEIINEKYEYGYLIKLKIESKIFIIRSSEDYNFLLRNYKLQEKEYFKFLDFDLDYNYFLDYNKISMEYDGIYNLIINLSILINGRRVNVFNGWDIVSLVLFNHNCYNIIKRINLKRFY